MTGVPVLVEQVTVLAVTVPLVVLLAVTARGRPRRELLPRAAVAVLLLESVASAFLPDDGRIGAAWFAAFPMLMATYPDGRVVPRWFVVPVVASFVPAVAVVVTHGAVTDTAWFAPWIGIAQTLLVVGQIHRYRRRASTAERERVRWGLLGVLVCVGTFQLIMLVEGGTIGAAGPWSELAAALAVLPATAGLAVGLIAPRVYDVDVALRAVVAAWVAVPVLVGLHLAVLAVPGAVGWWAAAAVAVAAVPVLRLAGALADLLVFRGRRDPAAATAELARRLAADPDPARVPGVVLGTVVDALRLDGAALHDRTAAPGEPGPLSAVIGTVTGPTTDRPVRHLGEELATLVVPARRGESGPTRRDRDVLERLALHAGPALHGARALADLAHAHTRTLHAREEERRRLRRDLHDDLSPTLAGLRLRAAALARRAGDDPALAADAEHLADGIRAAAGQAREIAHDLRPPVLDDAGLAEAIRLRVHGSRADTLDVRVHAPAERLALPAAVDLAALRIVQEAVANVRRHAGARQCTVTLVSAGDELLVTVDDDGAGLPERVPPGLGLASIRERATELGGRAGIGPRPGGGTRVRVRLPFRPATSGPPEPTPGAPDTRAPQPHPVPPVPDAPEPAPQSIPRAPA